MNKFSWIYSGLIWAWHVCPVVCASPNIEETYARVSRCLDGINEKKSMDLKYPSDAQKHFDELMSVSRRSRVPYHSFSGYDGPWIENYFVEEFENRPLSYFGGLIPLFFQWVDIGKTGNITVFHELQKKLRQDVIYVTVSQDNNGLADSLQFAIDNIFVISAGGVGHAAIPLIKDELKPATLPKSYIYDIGFYGTEAHGANRHFYFKSLRTSLASSNLTYKIGKSTEWIENMKVTAFNLAPFGIGPTSFRLAEIIQLGRLPVYIYDDYPWVPYYGTNLSVATFGYVMDVFSVSKLIRRITHTSQREYIERMKQIHHARHAYTYDGIVQQLRYFFREPLGPNGGHITCAPKPTVRSTAGRVVDFIKKEAILKLHL